MTICVYDGMCAQFRLAQLAHNSTFARPSEKQLLSKSVSYCINIGVSPVTRLSLQIYS
jgi:hypothetical protein